MWDLKNKKLDKKAVLKGSFRIDGTMLLGAFRATLTAAQAPFFILGSASASCLWFFGLTTILSIFRGKITDNILQWINRICGCVIV